MDLRVRAEIAVKDACKAISANLREEEERKVADVIERAIVDAVLAGARESRSAAVACCSADQDMAHKLAEEIERANNALIANLSALR